MIQFLIAAFAWILFIGFVLVCIIGLLRLIAIMLGYPKKPREIIVHWENERGQKGKISIETQSRPAPAPKAKRPRPEWLRFLLEETPASLMEKRRRKKQRRTDNL